MRELGIEQREQKASILRVVIAAYRDAALVNIGFAVLAPLTIVPVVGPVLITIGGTLVACFFHGVTQLSIPLQTMGLTWNQAFGVCFRHRWTVIGLAFSRDLAGPIPVFGGAISAFESIGRIYLAARLLSVDRSRLTVELSQSLEEFLERLLPTEGQDSQGQ